MGESLRDIQKSIQSGFKYHLILNPDIEFGHGMLEVLYSYIEKHADVGLLMHQGAL
jgi:GT2 family glycosyltransferase